MKLSQVIVATALATGGSHVFAGDKPLENTDACFAGATNITAAEAAKLPFTEHSTRLTAEQRKCVSDVLDRNNVTLKAELDGLKGQSERTGKLMEYIECHIKNDGNISSRVAGLVKNGKKDTGVYVTQAIEEFCGVRP